MSPASLSQLLGYTAQSCRTVEVDDATPEDLDQLTQSCDLVIHEITGLQERIAQASKKVNGTPQPVPKKPHQPKPKPEVHPKPKPKPKEDQ